MEQWDHYGAQWLAQQAKHNLSLHPRPRLRQRLQKPPLSRHFQPKMTWTLTSEPLSCASIVRLFGLPQLPDSEPAEVSMRRCLLSHPTPSISQNRFVKFGAKPVKELRFHDLGSKRWIEWASAHQGLPRRGLRYIRPDDMPIAPGRHLHASIKAMFVVDLSSLAHMDSQRSALSRQVQDMANYGGLPVFALDDSNRLLLIPGRGSRIDTETHELGGNSIID